jgi:hypothetical protein
MTQLIQYAPVRRFHRFSVDIMAIRAGSSPRLDRVENISRGGARIRTRATLPVGTQHTFLLVLPGTEARTLVAPVQSVIAWATPFEIGLEFKKQSGWVDEYLERVAQVQPAWAGLQPLKQ